MAGQPFYAPRKVVPVGLRLLLWRANVAHTLAIAQIFFRIWRTTRNYRRYIYFTLLAFIHFNTGDSS
jgi:hypothetical protein